MAGARKRAALAEAVLKGQTRISTKQVFALCLVVHHGGCRGDIRRARAVLMKIPRDSGCTLLRQQMADRILVMKYRKQKFGTQFKLDGIPFPTI